MTKYREILRLASLGLSQQNIADSCGASKKTVNRILKRAKEINLYWPLDENETDAVIAEKLFPSAPLQISSGNETEQHDILELLHQRRKRSSTIFCSQYDFAGWYDQLGGDESTLAEAILDRIKYDAYRINIIPADASQYRSMREVYGMDPAKSD
ncbi:MAG: ATP-binding protein [Acidaminococcaceae bacterium]|nr:ATP-binding protein [Acidaminococcaceae bacterium]MBQ5344307.1 ATP-binding protein [Acidaminococcaceae bacterium]